MKMSEAILLVATLDWRVPDEMDKETIQGAPDDCLVSEDENCMYVLYPEAIGNNACLQIIRNDGAIEVQTIWFKSVFENNGSVAHTCRYDNVDESVNPSTFL